MAHSQTTISGQQHCFDWSDGKGRYFHVHANPRYAIIRVDSYTHVHLSEAHAVKLYEMLGKVYGPRPTPVELSKARALRGEFADLMLRRGISEGVDGLIMADVIKLIDAYLNEPIARLEESS